MNCQLCNGLIKPKSCSKTYCRSCYEKQLRKKNPENYRKWLDKNNKTKRDKARLKRCLPLDHPRLIAEAGTGHVDKRGYKCILRKGHPNAKNSKGRIYEHVWVMSEYLGRPLIKGESIHHKNGIRHDNRIENLELWSTAHPTGQRVEDKIAWCKEFLEGYGYRVDKI